MKKHRVRTNPYEVLLLVYLYSIDNFLKYVNSKKACISCTQGIQPASLTNKKGVYAEKFTKLLSVEVLGSLGRSGDDGQRKFLAKNFCATRNFHRIKFCKFQNTDLDLRKRR